MKKVLNIGCGGVKLTFGLFKNYKEIKMDTDKSCNPDFIGSITNLKNIKDNSIDAIWASHVIEHIYYSQLDKCFNEMKRVLKKDGFVIMLTPDISRIKDLLDGDLMKTVYNSEFGPISVLDILYGYTKFTNENNHGMAHKIIFNPVFMEKVLSKYDWIKGRVYKSDYDVICIFGKQHPKYDVIEPYFNS